MTLPASPPASFTPVHALAHVPPFNDVIDNNPCGKPSLTSVGGVNVAAQNLCQGHYAMQYGLNALILPIV